MRFRPAGSLGRQILSLLAGLMVVGAPLSMTAGAHASELRRTAIVEAVSRARNSIVNIHGEKNLDPTAEGEAKRRVNGMGTGVIVDERGYIITNHHVVDGVKRIMVTTADRESYVAKLVSRDPQTDLAVIKIDGERPFEVIDVGTSSDLMLGETVIAVGNAFGYEHTVTLGIISALHRTVQVSDNQSYEDLIQTDASINPGNSGGPLLNIDGDLIGINVAVRAGAQGIGFAIPADKVLNVASDLMSTRRVANTWHGLVLQAPATRSTGGVVVSSVDKESPASQGGLQSGDRIVSVGDKQVSRPLDVERALIGSHSGDKVALTVERNRQSITLGMTLAALSKPAVAEKAEPTWDVLGMRLEEIGSRQFQQYRSRYRGGLTVTEVRPESPAARQGIRRGDVLVGMHVWETISLENVTYILSRLDFEQINPLKFYILRGNETLYGHLALTPSTTTTR